LADSVSLQVESLYQEIMRQLKKNEQCVDDIINDRKHVMEAVKVDTLEEYMDIVNLRVLKLQSSSPFP
jgi:hypothetical protein